MHDQLKLSFWYLFHNFIISWGRWNGLRPSAIFISWCGVGLGPTEHRRTQILGHFIRHLVSCQHSRVRVFHVHHSRIVHFHQPWIVVDQTSWSFVGQTSAWTRTWSRRHVRRSRWPCCQIKTKIKKLSWDIFFTKLEITKWFFKNRSSEQSFFKFVW